MVGSPTYLGCLGCLPILVHILQVTLCVSKCGCQFVCVEICMSNPTFLYQKYDNFVQDHVNLGYLCLVLWLMVMPLAKRYSFHSSKPCASSIRGSTTVERTQDIRYSNPTARQLLLRQTLKKKVCQWAAGMLGYSSQICAKCVPFSGKTHIVVCFLSKTSGRSFRSRAFSYEQVSRSFNFEQCCSFITFDIFF